MNTFAAAGLFFVAIPSIIVGPFILIKGRKKVHLLWSAFLSAVALWGFGMYKIGTATNIVNSLFWWRIAEIGVIFIPVFLVHFVISFLGLKRKIFLSLFYIATALFLFFNVFTDYFIKNLYFAFNQFYYISSTPLYSIFICMFVASVVYVLFELTRAYRKSTSIIRYQIKYLIFAFFVGFSGGITSYPPVYGLKVYPAWNATIFVSVVMVAYAILKYRFMDIRIVVRKTVIYFVSAGFVYGTFYLIIWLYGELFGSVYSNGAYLLGLIISPLFVALFVWVNNRVRGIANKYLFFDLYTHQEIIAKLTDELTNSIDLNKIVESIVNSIKDAMQLDRAGILLIDHTGETIKYKIAKVIGFNENNGISLVQDNFLTRYLEKTQKPLVRDEMQLLEKDSTSAEEKQSFGQLAENMKHIEASLCLPMIISNKLIGIIVLGSKISSDAYTSEDLELLSTLSKQAAIAVDNARLYKEVQDFSKTLQQRVDEQTKEIRGQKEEVEKAYQVEKQAHEDLIKLDEAKTNFMLVTQHHLRTPLTSTMGFLDLLIAGTFGKVPKKILEAITMADASVKKEIGVVNDLLSVSSFQLGQGAINIESNVSLKNILEEIENDLKPVADNQKVYLKFENLNNVPNISADQKQLRMALQNIIDNAIKYTKEGGVNVKVKAEGDKLRIEVKDTGIGMNSEDQKFLFEKVFQRSKEAWLQNATGKGIGLYLSAQIIKAHGGKIWAESEGSGKGSTFNIELSI